MVLKTLGLLTLMAQSGLLIPVEEGSEFTVFTDVISVIGDGQSLAQSLSTFSAQMKSIEGMLRDASKGVLLLIDELAAGTDPGEGIALSIAILEELSRKGANIIVTTHFNELKAFAAATAGFQKCTNGIRQRNAAAVVSSDYRRSGESYALQIAKKLGIQDNVIKRSWEIVEAQQQRLQKGDGSAWASLFSKEGEKGKTAPVIEDFEKEEKSVESLSDKEKQTQYEIGDAVLVTSLGRIGIVYEKKIT